MHVHEAVAVRVHRDRIRFGQQSPPRPRDDARLLLDGDCERAFAVRARAGRDACDACDEREREHRWRRPRAARSLRNYHRGARRRVALFSEVPTEKRASARLQPNRRRRDTTRSSFADEVEKEVRMKV